MKPEFVKATAELIERIRSQAAARTASQPAVEQVIEGLPRSIGIYAPRDCTFHITLQAAPTRPLDPDGAPPA